MTTGRINQITTKNLKYLDELQESTDSLPQKEALEYRATQSVGGGLRYPR